MSTANVDKWLQTQSVWLSLLDWTRHPVSSHKPPSLKNNPQGKEYIAAPLELSSVWHGTRLPNSRYLAAGQWTVSAIVSLLFSVELAIAETSYYEATKAWFYILPFLLLCNNRQQKYLQWVQQRSLNYLQANQLEIINLKKIEIIVIIVPIPNSKPDIIIRDNEKGTCMSIDVAISGDRNVT